MSFFGKLFRAIGQMVTGKSTPEPTPTPTPTATPAAPVGSRSRRERVEVEIPREVRNREFNHWHNFEDYFDDVETLGETEYDETT